jgi:leucyl-tRNA synthetase
MKVLFDAGMVSHDEPFQKLVHQGMILGEDGEKMSKSRGNVINPDDVVKEYGADTLRLYEMFMGPLEKDKPWSMSAIEGVYRFLNRSWRLCVDDGDQDHPQDAKWLVTDEAPSEEDLKITHQTIKKVTEDIEGLRFNTAISQMMVFVNHFTKQTVRPKACFKPFIQLLNPYAPHMAEELWERMGEKEALTYAKWPEFDPKYLVEDKMTIAVQVLGKLKGTVDVAVDATQPQIEALAKELAGVQKGLEGKEIKKVIYVPKKILNFVVG